MQPQVPIPTPPQSNLKLALSLIALVLVGLAAYFTYITISRHGKIGVTLAVFPTTAAINLNTGQVVKNGTVYLPAGTYTANVSADGFAPLKQTFVINSDRHDYAFVLTAQSDAAKKWVADHPKEAHAIESIAGAQSNQDTNVFYQQNSIAALLPLIDTYFSIGYKVPGGVFTVTINTASPRYRYYALQQIENWGYDPAKLNIVFTDFKNPLGN
ncbi:hypothetical protein HJC99_03695 [Candidatus Saccharibacteria bacterium]|nr:hypothetical protein [Candidatus Saccharibacteria bacterium]